MAELTTTSTPTLGRKSDLGGWKKRLPWLYIILRHPYARIGVIIISLLILVSALAPLISPADPPNTWEQ